MTSTSLALGDDFKAGDDAVVITKDAHIVVQGKPPEHVRVGTIVQIKSVENERIILSKEGHWLDKKNAVPVDQAYQYFSAAIEREPNEKEWRFARALASSRKGDHRGAVEDFTEAIRLDPKDARKHYRRGLEYISLELNDKAIEDFSQAIVLDKEYSRAYDARGDEWRKKDEKKKAINDYDDALRTGNLRTEIIARILVKRGEIWRELGEFHKSTSDYNEAIKLDPNSYRALEVRANLLATCPEAKYRDGRQAIKDATKACDLTDWKHPWIIGSLAAAHAENGEFEKAIELQTRAVKLVRDAEDVDIFNKELDLLKARRPIRIK